MIGKARSFTFRPGIVDTAASSISFTYKIELLDNSEEVYVDRIVFHGVSKEQWKSVPRELIKGLCEDLSLACGSIYWRIHCAKDIRLDGFSLTKEQAAFWKEIYEKGLAEYFYLHKIDFRGLVSFPADAVSGRRSISIPRKERSLVALGGGKDSIVTAEALKSLDAAFDTVVIGKSRMQDRVSRLVGKPVIHISRTFSPALWALYAEEKIPVPGPLTMSQVFMSVFAAALLDYRYVIFSNESSADFPSLEYLGLPVNHQWTKSTEAELSMRRYVAEYLTKDIVFFSPLRQYSELFLVREFAAYPSYFFAFSGCNGNFLLHYDPTASDAERAFWCTRCPKCLFIFACMSAFLSKEIVVGIFGKNLYADHSLLPLAKRLLGIEGSKPFECVGTADEMIVAMSLASKRSEYKGDVLMQWFEANARPDEAVLARMEKDVFSIHGEGTIPRGFPWRGLSG